MKVAIKLIFAFTLYLVVGVVEAQSKCVKTTMGLSSMHKEQITLVNDTGQRIALFAFVADENYERASGFQHICPEVVDQVQILFSYDAEQVGRFHMQNVHVPLDIAFFNAEGRLIKSMLMETYSEDFKPLYSPGAPFQFALEARQGFFSEIGVNSENSFLLLDQ
ncbi:MAG: DUF192 domain-containing protein [bacterium]